MSTITTKEIRNDLQGFLRRLQQGEQLTVLYRSRPLVQIGQVTAQEDKDKKNLLPGSSQAIKHSLEIAASLRNQASSVIEPDQNLKEFYTDSLAEEYGIS